MMYKMAEKRLKKIAFQSVSHTVRVYKSRMKPEIVENWIRNYMYYMYTYVYVCVPIYALS